MKKYIVNIITVSNKERRELKEGGPAVTALMDILNIALKQGYESYDIMSYTTKGKLKNALSIASQIIKIRKKIQAGSLVLVQYPCLNVLQLFLLTLFLSKMRLVTLIHDINSIRTKGKLSYLERTILSRSDEMIVHTPKMKKYLEGKLNNNIEYKVLGCFPYLAAYDNGHRTLSKNVCFAGCIDKSQFFNKFVRENQSLNIIAYGTYERTKIENERLFYKGFFNPYNIGHIEGSWGLVWDGTSTSSCSGLWGDYLKIIAPHKFSLYIIAGLPVIVWEKSAMADFVKERKLGIVVASLSEISDRIDSISEAEYSNIVENIKKLQPLLSQGLNVKLP